MHQCVFLCRNLITLIAVFCFILTIAVSAPAEEPSKQPSRISLWPASSIKKAAITVHLPPKGNGAALIICPGGGYGGLVTGAEGHGIAAWLNKQGIAGIVLEYELPKGRPLVPLHDAQRALRTARANAKAWKLDPNRIGIIGFSAGGHLASTAGTHFDHGNPESNDSIEHYSCRPSYMVLVYPVITMKDGSHSGTKRNLLGKEPSAKNVKLFSNETQVTEQTPPTYLAHAKDDHVVVPENSQMFHKELLAHKVSSEYLELPSGGHGLNGYRGPMWDAWQSGVLKWLVKQEIIPADPK